MSTLGLQRVTQNVTKKIYRNSVAQFENAVQDSVVSMLTGSTIRYKPLPVKSPLASASLFCSFLRHKVIRKNEFPGFMIKKVLQLLQPRSHLWNAQEWPEGRKRLLVEMILSLQRRLQFLNHKKNFYAKFVAARTPSSLSAVHEEVDSLLVKIDSLKQLLASMQAPTDVVYTSLYPSTHATNSLHSSFVSMTPGIAAQASLYSNLNGYRKVVGMSIRIAGPRKGNRRMVWRKSIGASSTNSVGLVVSEASQVQLPSRIGVFGIQVKIVYAKRERLASEKFACLPMVDNSSGPDAATATATAAGKGLRKREPLFGFGTSTLRNTRGWDREDRLIGLLNESTKR